MTDENAATVAAICERLDHLPLAIELAAARSRLFAPAALLDRLERSLDVLTGGARDLRERQRTLRAAIAWSHDPLDAPDQGLFRRLAVFAGGWTIDSAEAVCDPPGDLGRPVEEALLSLVEKSLVVEAPTEHGEARFIERPRHARDRDGARRMGHRTGPTPLWLRSRGAADGGRTRPDRLAGRECRPVRG
ncbi:MAG: hypothetical protein FJ038_11150 [Chloroflexi bacterium]|nr:hypothetical protein [Chloroflexota bacterium]